MVREKILLDQPGMREITELVKAEMECSGIAEGVCVITVLDERAAVVAVKRERAEVRRDIMEDLERMFPPRVNYRAVERMDESVHHAVEAENAAEVQKSAEAENAAEVQKSAEVENAAEVRKSAEVENAAEVQKSAEEQTALGRTLPKSTAVTLKQAAVEAAARSKAAVTGGSLDVIIRDGSLALPHDQGIFVAGYAGGLELEIVIMCS